MSSGFWSAFWGLFFPHRCPLCYEVMVAGEKGFCSTCRGNLPLTYNWLRGTNSLTDLFAGRVPLRGASAYLFYGSERLSQRGIHSFKYFGNRDIAYYFGAMYGRELALSGRFNEVEILIPVPLHRLRFLSRGYNQSEIFCKGMASQMNVTVECRALRRIRATSKQALKRGHAQRWQNVQGAFSLARPDLLLGRNIMIVDDVITTGSTVEACVRAINEKLPASKVWIGSCAMAGGKRK